MNPQTTHRIYFETATLYLALSGYFQAWLTSLCFEIWRERSNDGAPSKKIGRGLKTAFLRSGRQPEETRTVLSLRCLYHSSLMKKRYLTMWIWLCEDKFKVKIIHFRLTSAPHNISHHCWAQHVACFWPRCCDMLGVAGSSLKMVKFKPTTSNMSQKHATCCAQQWWDMLCWHVAIVWPGL